MKICLFSMALSVFFTLATDSSSAWARTSTDGQTSRADAVEKIYGVTIDNVENVPGLVTSLQSLAKRPTARIVFDEFVPAADYAEAINAIHPVAAIMGELLDSQAFGKYSVNDYAQRVKEYLDAFPTSVDLWEVGNEINGEWLGKAPDVVAKLTAAYDLVKAKGRPAVLTLYYNDQCWEKPENEMFAWANANVPDRLKKGLDYVLVSYYEDDCNGLQPDWPSVFGKLGLLFPAAKVGFGEIGTKDADRKVAFIHRYYGMDIAAPRFIGGYFWWYFRQDMVPRTTIYWSALNEAWSRH